MGVVARQTGSIPDAPGSYQFLDKEGRVIYVGKAKSLRSRLSNYFLQPELLAERTRQMVTTAESVEWIVAKNEVEAFFLEFNLIKRHQPRFNIRLKDDKSYPYLAVTLDEDWPRAMVLRGKNAKCVTSAPTRSPSARRSTSCCARSDRTARRRSSTIIASVDRASHIENARRRRRRHQPRDYDKPLRPVGFLDDEHDAIIQRLEARMRDAADQLEFELAARVRDQLASVRKAIERQQMVASREEDFDLIGLDEDLLEASVQVFYVRKGRVVGRKGLVVDKVEDGHCVAR